MSGQKRSRYGWRRTLRARGTTRKPEVPPTCSAPRHAGAFRTAQLIRGARADPSSVCSPPLALHVRPCPTLTAALRDRVVQPRQRGGQLLALGRPAAPHALLEPLHRTEVSALAVAPPAGGDLVLPPGRAALDPGDDVVGRRWHERREGSTAPEADPALVHDRFPQPIHPATRRRSGRHGPLRRRRRSARPWHGTILRRRRADGLGSRCVERQGQGPGQGRAEAGRVAGPTRATRSGAR